jgi:hypothetical protein
VGRLDCYVVIRNKEVQIAMNVKLDYKQAKVTTINDYRGHNSITSAHQVFSNELREASVLSEKHQPHHCVIM